MANSWSDEQKKRARGWLPRLLAGKDRLTRFEKEQVLARVMTDVAPEPAPARRRWFFVFATASAAAALLLAIPLFRGDEFATRGGGGNGADFTMYCTTNEQRTPCQRGSKLLFELRPTSSDRYFAAFARRSDGTVIWYFPVDEAARSLGLTQQQIGVATTAFVLGPEHAPGLYRVYGLFWAQPLSRSEIRAQAEAAPRSLIEKPLVVVE